MTDDQRREAVKLAIRRYTAANTVSSEVARSALIKEGIYTESGKLRSEYGGTEDKKTDKPT